MTTLSLFPDLPNPSDAAPLDPLIAVPGLQYHDEFISPVEERILLAAVEDEPWSCQWQRRTQFYGKTYLPAAGDVGRGERRAELPPVPAWSDDIRQRLYEAGIMPRLPNQVGVNEYLPGQGIAGHVDFLGGSVVSLSLGSGCVMEFTRDDNVDAPWLYLQPRSIVVLTGDARHIWKHGIPRRKTDLVDGRALPRTRRVSITFRDV